MPGNLYISDRTDLSTESGSGPIQLARARLWVGTEPPADRSPIRRRIVWMRPSAHCRPQAKKRGKISEKWEYTVGMWNDVWLTEHRLQILASYIEVHNRWLNFHIFTSGPSFMARWSYRITHRVARTVKKAAKLNILLTARRLKVRPSARAASQLTHLAWENVTTDVTRAWRASVFRSPWSIRGRLCNIY